MPARRAARIRAGFIGRSGRLAHRLQHGITSVAGRFFGPEDVLHLELLGAAVVVVQSEDFADDAAARLPLDMDDIIDGLADLGFHVLVGGLRMAAENEVGEAAQRLRRRVGVDGGERSGVPGVEGVEQRPRLGAADLAQDDPVGPAAERRSSGVRSKVSRLLEGIGLALEGDDVRLLDQQAPPCPRW